MQSSTLAASMPIPTKQWDVRRFEHTVATAPRSLTFIQVGSSKDPAIPGTRDLRGRTSLAEIIQLVASAELFVGPEGFLAHLARAVDCPAVVVFGGRSLPTTYGYSCNENLVAHPPCAPCGLNAGCPHDMACMEAITVNDVVAAIVRIMDRRSSRPLPHDVLELPAP
jgi:ADP-heptose:LPS heptosyltransferase